MSRTVVQDITGHVRPTAQDRHTTPKGCVLSGCPVDASASQSAQQVGYLIRRQSDFLDA